MNRVLRLFRPIQPESPLWPITHRYAWSIPVLALLTLVATGLEGLGITLLIPMFGLLSSSQSSSLTGPIAMIEHVMGISDPEKLLVAFGVIILICVMLKGAVLAVNSSFVAWVDGKAGHDIRCALAQKLLELGFAFHLQQDSARLVNILASESWRTSEALRHRFNNVSNAVSAAVFGALLILINWKLALVVAIGALGIRTIQLSSERRARQMSSELLASNQRLADHMMRTIEAMRPIRIFGQEKREQTLFARSSDEVRHAHFRIERLTALIHSMLETVYAALFIGIMFGAHLAGVSLPIIITFMVLLYRFEPYLRNLNSTSMAIAATRASVHEVEWLLDDADKPVQSRGGKRVERIDTPIAFDNVSFSYAATGREAPALKQLSFRLMPGRITALIGHSGSGKSTIVNLICGLVQPSAGEIYVGGIPMAELDMRSWRERLGIAGQDIDLIDSTIGANIAYGQHGARSEDIVEAAELADIHDFIRSLPNGYDTEVGTRGLGLSGGQRQRIGLARAFLRKPDLLILDEATNAVDGLSEAAILSLLRGKDWGRTILVVSHRASTLAFCQDGIVIQDGALVEAGPLRELRAYQRMIAVVSN